MLRLRRSPLRPPKSGGPVNKEDDRRRRRPRRRPRRPPGRPRRRHRPQSPAGDRAPLLPTEADAAETEVAPPAAARTTFTPKPKPPAPVRPKTGPYAKDLKFLEEISELLAEERAIYQEQATSLRAEADSLALEREPGDVQFDEESGEGGTVTVDRERNLALSGQAALAVEEIDYASAAGGRQDLRLLRAVLPAHPQAPPAGPSLRPALRGLQERGAVAPLNRGGNARLRVVAFALAARRRGGRPGDHVGGRAPPPRRRPRVGAVRFGPAVQLRLRLQPLHRPVDAWSRCCSPSAWSCWPSWWRGCAPCPRRSAGAWCSGGGVGNLSERIVRAGITGRWPTSSR